MALKKSRLKVGDIIENLIGRLENIKLSFSTTCPDEENLVIEKLDEINVAMTVLDTMARKKNLPVQVVITQFEKVNDSRKPTNENECLSKIETILLTVQSIEERMKNRLIFDDDYLSFHDELLNLSIQLDAIKTSGNNNVKTAKKSALQKIQKLETKLDEETRSTDSQLTHDSYSLWQDLENLKSDSGTAQTFKLEEAKVEIETYSLKQGANGLEDFKVDAGPTKSFGSDEEHLENYNLNQNLNLSPVDSTGILKLDESKETNLINGTFRDDLEVSENFKSGSEETKFVGAEELKLIQETYPLEDELDGSEYNKSSPIYLKSDAGELNDFGSEETKPKNVNTDQNLSLIQIDEAYSDELEESKPRNVPDSFGNDLDGSGNFNVSSEETKIFEIEEETRENLNIRYIKIDEILKAKCDGAEEANLPEEYEDSKNLMQKIDDPEKSILNPTESEGLNYFGSEEANLVQSCNYSALRKIVEIEKRNIEGSDGAKLNEDYTCSELEKDDLNFDASEEEIENSRNLRLQKLNGSEDFLQFFSEVNISEELNLNPAEEEKLNSRNLSQQKLNGSEDFLQFCSEVNISEELNLNPTEEEKKLNSRNLGLQNVNGSEDFLQFCTSKQNSEDSNFEETNLKQDNVNLEQNYNYSFLRSMFEDGKLNEDGLEKEKLFEANSHSSINNTSSVLKMDGANPNSFEAIEVNQSFSEPIGANQNYFKPIEINESSSRHATVGSEELKLNASKGVVEDSIGREIDGSKESLSKPIEENSNCFEPIEAKGDSCRQVAIGLDESKLNTSKMETIEGTFGRKIDEIEANGNSSGSEEVEINCFQLIEANSNCFVPREADSNSFELMQANYNSSVPIEAEKYSLRQLTAGSEESKFNAANVVDVEQFIGQETYGSEQVDVNRKELYNFSSPHEMNVVPVDSREEFLDKQYEDFKKIWCHIYPSLKDIEESKSSYQVSKEATEDSFVTEPDAYDSAPRKPSTFFVVDVNRAKKKCFRYVQQIKFIIKKLDNAAGNYKSGDDKRGVASEIEELAFLLNKIRDKICAIKQCCNEV